MRSDINKAVTERPRSHSSSKFRHVRHQKRNKFDVHDDVTHIKHQSMLNPHSYRKDFSDLLAPLRGFIQKSIGKKWDSVYSELCANFNSASWQGQHIKDHLTDFVVFGVYRDEDGTLMANSYQGPRPLNDWRFGYRLAYVDPKTNILRPLKQRRRKRKELVDDFKRYVDQTTMLERHENGTWFMVKLVPMFKQWEFVRSTGSDVLVQAIDDIPEDRTSWLCVTYSPDRSQRLGFTNNTQPEYIPVSRKQLNTEELKKYKALIEKRTT